MKSIIEEVQEQLHLDFKDPEEQYSEAIAVRAKVTRLRENDDFKWLVAVMQNNLDGRVQAVFGETKDGLDGAMRKLEKLAEIRGFSQAMQFANSLYDGAQVSIEKFGPLVEKESE
jgi:hypothetical protein